jgi:hypothetical protein
LDESRMRSFRGQRADRMVAAADNCHARIPVLLSRNGSHQNSLAAARFRHGSMGAT